MEDLKEVFSVEKLSEDELGQLEFVLLSPSYERVFKPWLLGMAKSTQELMLDRTEERKQRYPDDLLAGQTVALKSLVAFLDSLVLQINMSRVVASQDHTPEQEYEKMRALGWIRHSGQAQDPEDLKAAEDF